MIIFGIDPHVTKPYGFAILDDGRLMCSGEGTLNQIDDLMLMYSPEVVAVEDQYMAFNYNTAKKLSWSAGKIAGLAEVRGIRFEFVNVASWKAKMKAQEGTHIDRVQELFGHSATDDEASAILIAAYADKYLQNPVVKAKKPKKAKKAKKIIDKVVNPVV